MAQGGELDRQHHQKHIRKQAHRVDAIRQGRAITALFAFGELEGLAGVGQVPNHQTNPCGGKDGAKDQGIRVAEHPAAQPHDQQDLDQVVEAQPQKTIEITGHPPPWGADGLAGSHRFSPKCCCPAFLGSQGRLGSLGRLSLGRGIDTSDQGSHGFLIGGVELGEATAIHLGHDLDQRPIE